MKCIVCKRSFRGEIVFLLMDGSEMGLCGPKCESKYENDETGAYDVNHEGRPSVSVNDAGSER